MTTELDYAYLADYAAVEGGRLTAVGASFTHVQTATLPVVKMLSVAGRVRTSDDSEGFRLGVMLRSPDGEWALGFDGFVDAAGARPYDGKKGVLFALQTSVTLTTAGLYTVDISIEGQPVRTLKFDVTEV